MTEALLKTGKHTITALTRAGKQNTFPDGVSVRKVDYERPETVVEALRGQDALVITMAGTVPQELQLMLVKAAGEASVPWIMPNEWSPDSANEALLDDVFLFKPKGSLPASFRSIIVVVQILDELTMFLSCGPENNRRSWQELVHCSVYRLLVRDESVDTGMLRYRSREPHSHLV